MTSDIQELEREANRIYNSMRDSLIKDIEKIKTTFYKNKENFLMLKDTTIQTLFNVSRAELEKMEFEDQFPSIASKSYDEMKQEEFERDKERYNNIVNKYNELAKEQNIKAKEYYKEYIEKYGSKSK